MFAADTPILIVDDMQGARVLLVRQLKELGFTNIQEAPGGQEAIDTFQHMSTTDTPIGLAIVDMRMPNVDGRAVLKFVRSHAKINKTPFLVLSAESDREIIVDIIREGADNYIIKPASTANLKQHLEKLHARLFPA